MFAGLWELGNMVSYLLGAPHSLLALVTGKGCKQIEFLPPDGNSPGDVCLYLRRRHIPNWCWHDGAPEHDAKTGTTERRACFVVSQKQARWVEQVMLDYGCCILSPLEDQNAPRYAENVRERAVCASGMRRHVNAHAVSSRLSRPSQRVTGSLGSAT